MVLKCGILRLDKHREILKLEGPLDHKQSFGLRRVISLCPFPCVLVPCMNYETETYLNKELWVLCTAKLTWREQKLVTKNFLSFYTAMLLRCTVSLLGSLRIVDCVLATDSVACTYNMNSRCLILKICTGRYFPWIAWLIFFMLWELC